MSDEIYECAGCAGEVPIVDAIWLPDHQAQFKLRGNPYCAVECFERRMKHLKDQVLLALDETPGQDEEDLATALNIELPDMCDVVDMLLKEGLIDYD